MTFALYELHSMDPLQIAIGALALGAVLVIWRCMSDQLKRKL